MEAEHWVSSEAVERFIANPLLGQQSARVFRRFGVPIVPCVLGSR
jgi:hypothetical protein